LPARDSINAARRFAGSSISESEPTWRARSTLWIASNSAATEACFSSVTSRRTASRAERFSSDGWRRTRSDLSLTRGSSRAWAATSRLNTTAAAGPPPITDAYEPESATAFSSSFSSCEKTT
jgi:hypothetical protein